MKILKILSVLSLIIISSIALAIPTGVNLLVFAIPQCAVFAADYLGIIQLPKNILAINFGAITTFTPPEVDGTESMGGFGSVAYLAFVSDISAYPNMPDIEAVTDVKDLAKLTGAYTMKAQKYFYKIRVKPNSIKAAPEGQGEVGGRSFKVKGQFYIPGLTVESMGFARLLNNKFGILIVPDQSGSFRLNYGTEDLPLTFAPTGDSGQNPADPKGMTFAFECDSFAPGWVYNGAIPISGTAVAAIS
jgi:hypothetical protein